MDRRMPVFAAIGASVAVANWKLVNPAGNGFDQVLLQPIGIFLRRCKVQFGIVASADALHDDEEPEAVLSD